MKHKMANNDRDGVVTVTCGEASPYSIITRGIPANSGLLRVECVRCGQDVTLLLGMQRFDAVESLRSAVVFLQLILDHHDGVVPYFRALIDTKKK